MPFIFKQEEQKAKRVKETHQEESPRPRKRKSINELPDTDSWFKRKLGGMFNEDSSRDTEMR